MIFFAMFAAQAVGSVFNIEYNLVHISPLLSVAQKAAFQHSINIFNALAYPILVGLWAFLVFRLNRQQHLEAGILKQQRAVINLPIHAAIIAASGWIFCIPALFIGLRISGEKIDPNVFFHFPVSVIIAMIISLAIGYFSIDWLRQKYLFPHFFQHISPSQIEGAHALSISARGKVWTVAASICPIIALLLLLISPSDSSKNLWFAVSVAGAGIFSAVISAILMGRLIVRPISQLRVAAQAIGRGEMDVKIDNLRADEFGILADEFNSMVAGLREKERIENKIGRHVGKEIAREILKKGEGDLNGVEREVSVLFADIRGFTTVCESLDPKDAVLFLNTYHEHMSAVIDANGGIINQLIGDGIMAIFGATGGVPDHARLAVGAGIAMIRELQPLGEDLKSHGFEPIKIGVGINTGRTVVGTIGSSRRMEYTAIGDAVNTAARIESLTKELGCPLLIAESTWARCGDSKPNADKLPPHPIRGRKEGIILYSVET